MSDYWDHEEYGELEEECEALKGYIRAALAVWDMRVVEMDSDAECCRKIVAILKDSVKDMREK